MREMKWSMRCTSCLTLNKGLRRMALSVISAKKRSTWFSHELQVGMRCMCQRSLVASQALTFGGGCGGTVVTDPVHVQLGWHPTRSHQLHYLRSELR